MVRIKICGITNLEDALAAVEYGADALGFVLYNKSPRVINPKAIKEIVSQLPPFITTVGVFVNEKSSEIEKIVNYAGLNVIQLHGSESSEETLNLIQGSKKVIKAIRVKDLTALEPLKKYGMVSAFLLDTYSPDIPGGTGQKFNWDIAQEAKGFGRIILSGGLTPENIEEAIRLVQPYGVDVSTGVEGSKKGIKDHKKLRLFIERARRAYSY